jgi:hypothetical protein
MQGVIFEKKVGDIYTRSRISGGSGAIHVKEQALSWRSSLVHADSASVHILMCDAMMYG